MLGGVVCITDCMSNHSVEEREEVNKYFTKCKQQQSKHLNWSCQVTNFFNQVINFF